MDDPKFKIWAENRQSDHISKRILNSFHPLHYSIQTYGEITCISDDFWQINCRSNLYPYRLVIFGSDKRHYEQTIENNYHMSFESILLCYHAWKKLMCHKHLKNKFPLWYINHRVPLDNLYGQFLFEHILLSTGTFGNFVQFVRNQMTIGHNDEERFENLKKFLNQFPEVYTPFESVTGDDLYCLQTLIINCRMAIDRIAYLHTQISNQKELEWHFRNHCLRTFHHKDRKPHHIKTDDTIQLIINALFK